MPGLDAVVHALDGNARLVGGVVRDTLAGQATKDVELATPLLPEMVIAKLQDAGLKAAPTGLEAPPRQAAKNKAHKSGGLRDD